MVQCLPAFFALVPLEHREINHPKRFPLAFDHTEVVAEFDAQCADRFVDDFAAVRAEENQVAVFRARALKDDLNDLVIEEFDDRRLQAFTTSSDVVDLNVSQTFRAVTADVFGVAIDLFTGQLCATRHVQRDYAAVIAVCRTGKDLEFNLSHRIGQFDEFQRDTHIRLVRTEAMHGFSERHTREWFWQVNVHRLLEEIDDHVLHQRHDVVFVDEGHFDIELGEFRLTVGAQIFVTEATRDLIVAVHTTHHQQLLKELWRLRQREEVTGVGAARHEVVTRAFRGRTRQDRRVDFDELIVIEVAAQTRDHLRTHAHTLLHLRTAQVDVTVFQAILFMDVFVVELERRGVGTVEDLQIQAKHFDLARGQV